MQLLKQITSREVFEIANYIPFFVIFNERCQKYLEFIESINFNDENIINLFSIRILAGMVRHNREAIDLLALNQHCFVT